ncbi:hypothetical protein [Streptomyces sp. NPDC002763]|uniref:hypothetical protein n=1 Tax=Streptomyces sp. NPDC002763 TaxID=3154427 RepID=UPI0033276C35
MSGEKQGAEAEPDFEDRVRALLAGDASALRPPPVPYPEIRRRGMLERRRRRLGVTGVALATLAVVPVGAYAIGGGGGGAVSPARPEPSVRTSARPTPSAPSTPSVPGPARPATAGQLLDGVTYENAAAGLGKCIAYDKANRVAGDPGHTDLGTAADYRIILAMKSTGDSNAPGDGISVVAVREKPTPARLICTVKGGEAQGLNTSVGNPFGDSLVAVVPDIDAGKLYQQSYLDKGHWKLPFRWGVIGGYRSSVSKVTVSYGGSTSKAVLDHGWFVATGTLHRQVTEAPRLRGYDWTGKLVYDSDQDGSYEKTLP